MRSRHPVSARPLAVLAALWLALLAAAAAGAAPGTRTITFQDLMKFRAIQAPVVSDDGKVVAYALQPDRGDGEGVVHVLASGKAYRVPRGGSPIIASGSRHVGLVVKLAFADAEKPAKDRPKPGLAIVDTATGAVTSIENAERLAFSDDGRWAAYLFTPPEPKKDDKAAPVAAAGARPAATDPKAAASDATAKKPAILHLRSLQTGADVEVGPAASFAFDPASRYVAWSAATEDGAGNGVFVRSLADAAAPAIGVAQAAKGRYEALAWTREGSRLAFVAAVETEKDKPGPGTLWLWDGSSRQGRVAAAPEQAPRGWTLPLKNELSWSRDGRRLFFGFKPAEPEAAPTTAPAKAESVADPYDFDRSSRRSSWTCGTGRTRGSRRSRKSGGSGKRTGRTAPCCTPTRERSWRSPTGRCRTSPSPRTTGWRWALRTRPTCGRRPGANGIATCTSSIWRPGRASSRCPRLRDQASLSPDGRWIAFFEDRQWSLYDVEKGTKRRVPLEVTLFDEEHDTPDTPRAYGLGGWVDDGASLLVYDTYDIWQVPAAGGAPVNLTNKAGRTASITFRVVQLDPDARSLSSREPLLLSAYHNVKKTGAFMRHHFGKPGVRSAWTNRSFSGSWPRPRRPTRSSTRGRTTTSSPTLGCGPRVRSASEGLGRQPAARRIRVGNRGTGQLHQPRRAAAPGRVDQAGELRGGQALPGDHLLLRAAIPAAVRVQRAGREPPAVVRGLRRRRLCGLPAGCRLHVGPSRARRC